MRTSEELAAIAARARYQGSPEHKRVPNPLAVPRFVSGKSDCDEVAPGFSQDPLYVLFLLQEAIRRGQVSGMWEGEFPRYVHGWALESGERVLFRGRLTNRIQGIYKGYFESLADVSEPAYSHLVEGGAWHPLIQ